MLANWVCIWGHWPVILGTATVLFVHRRDRYYVLRNALFVSGAIGFLFFAFFLWWHKESGSTPRSPHPGKVLILSESSIRR